jgi:hypothetical protein
LSPFGAFLAPDSTREAIGRVFGKREIATKKTPQELSKNGRRKCQWQIRLGK